MQENGKPGYWAVIPAGIRYDPELPPNAKLLYGEISALTDMEGFCFASNRYFEELFELSERTVIRLLRVLAARGYIHIVDADGGRSRRRIYAGVNPLQGGDKNVSAPLTKMSVPPDKNVTHINTSNNNNPPKAPKRGEREVKAEPDWKPDMFQRFWQLYPVHKSKQAAMRAWDKLKPSDALLSEMSRGLKSQISSEEWQRGIGIPHPSTYLNQRRWEDEVALNVSTPPAAVEEGVQWI